LLTILLAVGISKLFAQTTEDNKYEFPARVFASNDYRADSFPRFTGIIKKTGTTHYRFGDKTIILTGDTALLPIFQLGIVDPDILFGKETTQLSAAAPDTLSREQRMFYNAVRNDSVSICCVEELPRLNPNAQTKRFKFWVTRIGMSNPIEYYLELHNNKATINTTLKEFIEGAFMSFYYKGTVII